MKNKKKKNNFIRNCPQCKNIIKYKYKRSIWKANKDNRVCHSCKCKNLSLKFKGRKFTSKWLENLRKNHANFQGKKNPFFGKHHSEESIRKMRIGLIKYLNEKFGGGICPRYNESACKLIDEYGQKNGYTFQHAMNGGEYFISELGYWVDGYDKEKNTVIEYYEKAHNKIKKIKKDEKRKNNIIKYLHCKFIILHENKKVEII